MLKRIIYLLLLANVTFAQQGPSIRVSGDIPSNAVPMFTGNREVVDSGVRVVEGMLSATNEAGTTNSLLPLYPVFVFSPPPNYTDVELKASIVNYSNSTERAWNENWRNDTQLWIDTQRNNSSWTHSECRGHGNIFITFTPTNGLGGQWGTTNDARQHILLGGTSIAGFTGLTNITSIMICPNRKYGPHNAEATWMRPDNPNIKWVFRYKHYLTGGETNQYGPVWRIIEPTWTHVLKQ